MSPIPAPMIASARENSESAPGGDIMIHGLPDAYAYLGALHTKYDWTDGCIAVSNSEIEEIWKLVPVGTINRNKALIRLPASHHYRTK